MVNVSTRAYDNSRCGANLAETVITNAAVRARGLVKFATLTLPGDARGTEGTALVQCDVLGPDGLPHDVVVFVGMGGYVCAWDARSGDLLMSQRVARPVLGIPQMDMYQINQHWSLLSTPVIDPASGTLYMVTMSSVDGTYAKAEWEFLAFSLLDGALTAPRLPLAGATYQPPEGLPVQSFGRVERKQRCALTMTDIDGVQTVFVAAGSFDEDNQNQGWVIAVDVSTGTPAIAAAFSTCSRLDGGGVWMAGQGPCADAAGDIGILTGNGAYDGVTDFGEACVRLRYTPATETRPASLAPFGWVAPYTDAGLVGGAKYQTLADPSLIPGYDDGSTGLLATSNRNGSNDADLGSAGVLLVTRAMSGLSKDIVVFGGKHGLLWVADWNNLGQPTLADFAPDKIEERLYSRCFLSPPVWGSYYCPLSSTPTDLSQLPSTWDGKTHHIHSTPVFYHSKANGPTLFVWGENGNLRAFGIEPDFSLRYLACGAEVASVNCPAPGGMPGGMLTLCADAETPGSGVLIATIPYGDANKTVGAGRMLAYDPETFGRYADGSGAIEVLWDSQRQADAFTFNKFTPATVANGVIYRPNYNGTVDLYRLAGRTPA